MSTSASHYVYLEILHTNLSTSKRKVFGFAVGSIHATTLTSVLYEDVAADFHTVSKVIGPSFCPESKSAGENADGTGNWTFRLQNKGI